MLAGQQTFWLSSCGIYNENGVALIQIHILLIPTCWLLLSSKNNQITWHLPILHFDQARASQIILQSQFFYIKMIMTGKPPAWKRRSNGPWKSRILIYTPKNDRQMASTDVNDAFKQGFPFGKACTRDFLLQMSLRIESISFVLFHTMNSSQWSLARHILLDM